MVATSRAVQPIASRLPVLVALRRFRELDAVRMAARPAERSEAVFSGHIVPFVYLGGAPRSIYNIKLAVPQAAGMEPNRTRLLRRADTRCIRPR